MTRISVSLQQTGIFSVMFQGELIYIRKLLQGDPSGTVKKFAYSVCPLQTYFIISFVLHTSPLAHMHLRTITSLCLFHSEYAINIWLTIVTSQENREGRVHWSLINSWRWKGVHLGQGWLPALRGEVPSNKTRFLLCLEILWKNCSEYLYFLHKVNFFFYVENLFIFCHVPNW